MRFLSMRFLAQAAFIGALGIAACAPAHEGKENAENQAEAAEARARLAIMGTIPIYWGEAQDLDDILGGTATRHWARSLLEQRYQLQPISLLTADELADYQLLLLAQPRALTPAENVALAEWVRNGGRLLLFADPLLTGESHFPIGDRRRPQDVIILSPILRHWGLELEFVEDQAPGMHMREIAGTQVPINLPGRFVIREVDPVCSLDSADLLALCMIGQGRVVIFADAALLDLYHPAPEAAGALEMLSKLAFE